MRLATLVAGFLLLAVPVAYAAPAVIINDPNNVSNNLLSSYSTTDKGGTISVGGTPQTAIAANTLRKIWCIQNDPSATEVLSVRVGGVASATAGIILAVGAQACSIPGVLDTGAVSVYAATGGHRWFGFEGQ
jgi:hypothetical protein